MSPGLSPHSGHLPLAATAGTFGRRRGDESPNPPSTTRSFFIATFFIGSLAESHVAERQSGVPERLEEVKPWRRSPAVSAVATVHDHDAPFFLSITNANEPAITVTGSTHLGSRFPFEGGSSTTTGMVGGGAVTTGGA